MAGTITRKKVIRWTRNAVLVSVLVHFAFVGIAAFIVAIRTYHKPEAVFQGDPPPRPRLPPRKLEMKVKVKDLQKRSSRPKLQPRIATMAPSDIAIPEIKKIPKQNKKIQRNFSTVGASGFGQGIGGGLGTGMGGGVSFFGLKGVGQRHLFVVDLSGSMSPNQLSVLKKELIESVRQLRPGMEYQVICFAGPVWFLGDTFQQKPVPSANKLGIVKAQDGKVHRWRLRSMSDVDLLDGKKTLPTQSWLPATRANIDNTLAQVNAWSLEDKVLGTTWHLPLRVAMDMEPRADVIYFMTDGAANGMDAAVREVTKMNEKKGIVINAVAMVAEKSGQEWLKRLAENNGGAYTYSK